jgi:protoheme IX farnesyltransferase
MPVLFVASGIYTPFKQYSIWNTTIGSVVGAIPPVMGFVAAAGLGTWAGGMEALMSYESAVLASLLFLWQVRHAAVQLLHFG